MPVVRLGAGISAGLVVAFPPEQAQAFAGTSANVLPGQQHADNKTERFVPGFEPRFNGRALAAVLEHSVRNPAVCAVSSLQ